MNENPNMSIALKRPKSSQNINPNQNELDYKTVTEKINESYSEIEQIKPILDYIQRHPIFTMADIKNEIGGELGKIRIAINVLLYFNFLTKSGDRPKKYFWCNQTPRVVPINIPSLFSDEDAYDSLIID